ncbi:hypothetical protein BH23BAC1_BH23BAC1_16820 [soil metagenome]
MKTIPRFIVVFFVLLFSGCASRQNLNFSIFTEVEDPKIFFAIEEIKAVLHEKGIEVNINKDEIADIKFTVDPQDKELKPEGFKITRNGSKVRITGYDAAGVMYGGLELAEQIKLFGLENVDETLQNPYMELRGTKFNIPLDVRTPSYSDASHAAQNNIPEMWNIQFWKDYIDNLARYRFNFISLWSLHPFPSMVKVPDYPDVALNDVQRSTISWNEHYHLHGTGLDAEEIISNTEVVKNLPIEDKILFWREVMNYAKDRNIDFFVVTWNIFVNGTAGKYGITESIDNEITKDYFKKSVKEMFITYPDLAGIGLTTGENMPGAGFKEKEDWVYDTYAQGLMEVAEEMPDRKFTFIHRQHQAGAKEIAQKFKPLMEKENVEFLFSFKYAQAHVFSAIEQPFHENFVKDLEGNKILWTLRNDDVYYFRWGAPDFVRDFIKNIPHEVSRGFYYGSDQWVWGREFLMKEPDSPRQLEIVKHWYHWMLWGRLGYNPNLSNDRFIKILQSKYPEVDGEKLFTAWQNASMIYPVTTGFHWGPLDFQWYIEACKSRPEFAQNESGFHDVNRFISLPPHPKSGFQSIPDFVKMTIEKGNSDLLNPFEVADNLHSHTDIAFETLENLKAGNNKELKITLHDIKTIALLGKYYAFKITGATNLALFRETKKTEYQAKAVEHLNQALNYWIQYTDTALQQNLNPLWTNRVGYVDWLKLTKEVEMDIEIAKLDSISK